jgi:hypothetical protein
VKTVKSGAWDHWVVESADSVLRPSVADSSELFNFLHDGHLALNADEEILEADDDACTLLSLSHKDRLGRKIRDLSTFSVVEDRSPLKMSDGSDDVAPRAGEYVGKKFVSIITTDEPRDHAVEVMLGQRRRGRPVTEFDESIQSPCARHGEG